MSDELIGGRYRVIDSLRTTNFCVTYAAQDTHLPGEPSCVVKKLQPQSDEGFLLDTARRLFSNEAKVLYRLSDHPQIPRLSAHFEVEKEFYLVQEFIEGKDLSQTEIVPGSHWQEPEIRAFLVEVLKILAFVHQNNVIHRDIKPSNLIRRTSDNKIVLIDFGAVKEISSMTLTEGQGNVSTIIIGTPGYMASEQQRGDPRFNSDIYALGITAIQAMTGVHPDQLPRDRNTGEIIWRDRAPDCSDKLATILDRMICNDFRERYQNANEVLGDLDKIDDLDQVDTVVQTSNERRPTSPPGFKRLLLFVVLPLTLGLLFLSPKIWRAMQALKYYNEGNAMIQAGKYEQAIAAFDEALANRRDFAQAWTNKGFAQGKLGNHLEKFSSCAQGTNVAPDFAEAWNCRGLARFDLQQYEKALQEYNQAIAVDPEFYRAWFNKGQVLLKLGQPTEAIEATRHVLRPQPDYFLAWTQICQALYELEQYQDAKAHCEESLSINNKYSPTAELLEKVEQELKK